MVDPIEVDFAKKQKNMLHMTWRVCIIISGGAGRGRVRYQQRSLYWNYSGKTINLFYGRKPTLLFVDEILLLPKYLEFFVDFWKNGKL